MVDNKDSLYEQQVKRDLLSWKRKVTRKPSLSSRIAKSAQTRINDIIPEKVHNAITATIKQMVRGVLFGAGYTAPKVDPNLTLEERELLVMQRIEFYKKTAAAEGGVTGMGGLLMGLADFPLLLGIKLKLQFDIAAYYGYEVSDFKERLFILQIFQLAFSSPDHRLKIYKGIEDWELNLQSLPQTIDEFDWRTFQQEYRDHIDLAKMAQLIPVIGAVVGVVVNYRLIKKLGDTAMQSYRMRWFERRHELLTSPNH